MHINVIAGDLTKQSVDAIVNAANRVMLGGGGLDGAIHRAAGPKLVEACRRVKKDADGVRCPTGEARITPGFDLPARFVIHTVGPVYRSDPDPPGNLARSFRNSLELAVEHGLETIGLPALSCGAFGYPVDECARIARDVQHLGSPGVAWARAGRKTPSRKGSDSAPVPRARRTRRRDQPAIRKDPTGVCPYTRKIRTCSLFVGTIPELDGRPTSGVRSTFQVASQLKGRCAEV